MIDFIIAGTALAAFFIFITCAYLASFYRRCPSNKILVVFGKVGVQQSS